MGASNIPAIKERLDIVDIAQDLTTLRKSGRTYRGLCPFHDEKHPSFHVFPRTQTFKCFSCGEQGSALDLYSHLHQISIAEAVKRLEEEFGLTRQKPTKPPIKLRAQDFEKLGLKPQIKNLYEEDEESFKFIVKTRIDQKLATLSEMRDRVSIPEFVKVLDEQMQYYHSLMGKIA
ncbi:MAG: CHC2 zinc finger domain-containing protein [Tepidibacillus sp.]